jgi:hypothetical protein
MSLPLCLFFFVLIRSYEADGFALKLINLYDCYHILTYISLSSQKKYLNLSLSFAVHRLHPTATGRKDAHHYADKNCFTNVGIDLSR